MLTVHSGLVLSAYKALKETKVGSGSVVALDPRSGAVLAIVSTPGFDPNSYVKDEYSSPRGGNEFLRALTGTYPPGSVFKIVSSIAALETGLSPAKKFYCGGSYALPTRVFKCWKKEGHGQCDFLEGLKNSCDVYYYNLGLATGPEALSQWALKFPFSKKISLIEFPEFGSSGFIPTPQWRAAKGGWYPGDTLNFVIGQGEILTTPMQIAALLSMVANRGTFYEPYVVARVQDPLTKTVVYERAQSGKPLYSLTSVSDTTWELLDKALSLVVTEGTGRSAMIPGYHIYGKTGTAQNPHGDDHSLFACYLKDPSGTPLLAVGVVVDNGGHGSSAAAPVARRVVQEFITQQGLLPDAG
ncbi:MAG: penicillin-binding transpeptidase domain-containing protein [Elusimicrobiota bacterium]